MSNLIGSAAKEQQVAGAQVFAVDGGNAIPRGLLIGVAWHVDAAASHQHLRKTGAVESKAGATSPCVGDSEEPFPQFDGFVDAQRSGINNHVIVIDPG
jgi:hypothetical protein